MTDEQFKAKYEKFYQQKALPVINDFNVNRKRYRNEAIAQKIFFILIICVLLAIIPLQFFQFVHFDFISKDFEDKVTLYSFCVFFHFTAFIILRYPLA